MGRVPPWYMNSLHRDITISGAPLRNTMWLRSGPAGSGTTARLHLFTELKGISNTLGNMRRAMATGYSLSA